MPTLTIEGRKVKVGEEFLQLSPEEQERAVEEIAGQIGVEPSAKPESSLAELGTEFMSEVNRTVGRNTVGLPDRLIEATTGYSPGAELMGHSYDEPRWYEQNVFTRDKPEPETAGERIAERAGQFTGEGVLLLGGLFGAGAKAGSAASQFGARPPLLRPGTTYEQVAKATGRERRKLAPKMGREATEQAATRFLTGPGRAPVAATAGELGGSAAAGLGAQLGREVSDTPQAEMIGALMGGLGTSVAPTAAAGRYGVRKARDVARIFTPGEQERQAKGVVADILGEHLTDTSRAAAQQTKGIREAVPGTRFTVAEATENPSLLRTQEAYERGLSGPDLDEQIARRRQNVAAIEQARGDLAPGAGGAEDVTRVAQRRREGLLGRIAGEEEELARQAQDIASGAQMGPKATRGRELRDILKAREGETKEHMKLVAREMGLDDTSTKYDFRPVRKSLMQALKPRSAGMMESDIPTDIRNHIHQMPNEVTLDDLRDLRSTILTEQAKVSSALAPNPRMSSYLERLKNTLDEQIDTTLRGANPEKADAFREFSEIYNREYADLYRRGPGAESLAKTRQRDYKLRDEEIAGEFFKAGDEEAAAKYRRIFGDSPEAAAAMEAAVLDDLYGRAATDLGELSPTKLASWARRHRNVFAAFPEIAQKVDSIDGAITAIGTRRAQLNQRRTAIERDRLTKELQSVETGVNPPERVVADALQNPMRMHKLVRSMKTPEAKAALARAVWTEALSQKNPAEFLKSHRPNIVAAMGEGAYENARKVAEAYRKVSLMPTPAGVAVDPNPFGSMEAALGTSLKTLSAHWFAVKSGRLGVNWMATNLAARFGRQSAGRLAQKGLVEALYDPEIANAAAQMFLAPARREEVTGKFMVRLWQAGLMPFDEEERAPVQ